MRSLELKIPPPVIALLCALIMWAAAEFGPVFDLSQAQRLGAAIAIALLGLVVAVLGVIEFKRLKTTVNPLKPENSSALVTRGIYRLSRNPMYVGMALVLLGWAAYLSAMFSLLGVCLFVCYLNHFQIGPEEKILVEKFGEAYQRYCQEVRRWL